MPSFVPLLVELLVVAIVVMIVVAIAIHFVVGIIVDAPAALSETTANAVLAVFPSGAAHRDDVVVCDARGGGNGTEHDEQSIDGGDVDRRSLGPGRIIDKRSCTNFMHREKRVKHRFEYNPRDVAAVLRKRTDDWV